MECFMGLGRARLAVHARVLRCVSIWQSSGSPRSGTRRLCHEWTSSGASFDPALACLVLLDYSYSLFVKLRKFGRICNVYIIVPRFFVCFTRHTVLPSYFIPFFPNNNLRLSSYRIWEFSGRPASSSFTLS